MAAPAKITLQNLNGDFIMNKKLSGDFDAILALQGVSWFTRTAIGYATITLHTKQYIDASGVTHIDIDQTLSGGIQGTKEERELTWQLRDHEDKIFGKVKGKSRYVKLTEIDDKFLTTGWAKEMEGADFIQTLVESVGNGWVGDQLWGFEVIDGQRRHVRHAVVVKGNKRKEVKLVYDYAEATQALDVEY